jgi:hypothetical protein
MTSNPPAGRPRRLRWPVAAGLLAAFLAAGCGTNEKVETVRQFPDTPPAFPKQPGGNNTPKPQMQ